MVSEKGYRRRTLEEIYNAKIEKAKELFGDSINTDENTALGKFIMICAYDQYHVEELAEKVYYSIFPQTSFGASLDRLAWSIALTRNPATPAYYKVRVTGTAGATIEAGFLIGVDPSYVGEETELNFENTTATVIDENGECEITVVCTVAGSMGNVSPSAINRIVNPVDYADTVEGIEVVEWAEDEESDYDFIRRYEVAREGKGSCNEVAIKSALMYVPTVRGAHLIVNESATESLNGIPPKTMACYVDGGDEEHQAIAEVIFDKKPLGIGTYGDHSVEVSYGALGSYTVNFSHAQRVKVYVNLTLETSAEFESDGNKQIKENILNYINSLGIGKSLVTTTLYSRIYSVTGVTVATVEVSTDGASYSGGNIEVEPFESCYLAEMKINGEVI